MSHAIETHALTRRYGLVEALSGLDLAIPEGSLYGLLGPNGAGKTTTIDLLMNLIRPTSGEATILGHPCTELGPEQLRSIGYVSAEQNLPLYHTVDQLCAYLAPLYPTWDPAFAERLCRLLDLPRDRRLSQLSRGGRMKAALVLAMAFRPRVLILDEPFSGLDAVVREDLVSGLLDPTQQEGWTLLVSSHDLVGLEPLVDHLAILRSGRSILDAPVEHLERHYRQVEVIFEDQAQIPEPLPPTWVAWRSAGRTASFLLTDFTSEEAIRQRLEGARHVECSPVGLRELFLTLCRQAPRGQEA